MVNKHRTLLLVAAACVLTLPVSGHAEATKPPVTVSDLDAIMQEEILFKAMANRAKQQQELVRFDSPAHTSTAASSILPHLAWRRSTASGWLAKLVTAEGASLIVSRGDPIPGGYVVEQINDEGVKLKRNGEVIDLTAASSGIRPSSQPPAPGAMNPPSPPMPQGLR